MLWCDGRFDFVNHRLCKYLESSMERRCDDNNRSYVNQTRSDNDIYVNRRKRKWMVLLVKIKL